MIDIKKACEYFTTKSVYCFTSDLDWASESNIQDTVDIFDELGLPLTVFITHRSKVIEERYSNCKEHVGLHPNFMPGSTHGATYLEQIDHCQRLWPEARYLRTHCLYDAHYITEELAKRGFKYDSSLCTSLQPYCTPIKHCSGLIRFPIFWADNIHSTKILERLNLPGLKIFIFHPVHLFKNVTFLRELAEHIRSNCCNVMYLDDLYSFLGEM